MRIDFSKDFTAEEYELLKNVAKGERKRLATLIKEFINFNDLITRKKAIDISLLSAWEYKKMIEEEGN